MNPSDSFGLNWSAIALQIVNVVLILLAITATIVVIGRARGGRLAAWLLVIWFLPIIGPLIALFRSKEPNVPRAE